MLASLEGDLVRDRFGTFGLPAIFSRSWLTRAFAELGQFAQGIAYGEEGVRQAEAFDNPYSLFVAYWGGGYLHLRKGEFIKAIAMFERPLGLCRDWQFSVAYSTAAALLAYAYALSGRVSEAIPMLERAVEQAGAAQDAGGY
jgi:tetratricopeptide (TPR) repeat protein